MALWHVDLTMKKHSQKCSRTHLYTHIYTHVYTHVYTHGVYSGLGLGELDSLLRCFRSWRGPYPVYVDEMFEWLREANLGWIVDDK